MKETKVLAQTARKSAFKRPEDVNNSKITKMKTRSRGQHKGSDDGEDSESDDEEPRFTPPVKPKKKKMETPYITREAPKKVEFEEIPLDLERSRRNGMIPYVDVPRMDPALKARIAPRTEPIPILEKREPAYTHKAPVEMDVDVPAIFNRMKETPITLTQREFLGVISPRWRKQYADELATKRIPTIPGSEQKVSMIEELEGCKNIDGEPYEIYHLGKIETPVFRRSSEQDKGVPEGSFIIEDPVEQYLNTLDPSQRAKKVLVARESHPLKVIYPVINGTGQEEALLDPGSQIISMAKDVAMKLGVSWDPNLIVNMQSANKQVESTEGLARNVPFRFDDLTLYLQVHVMSNPAYRVLLGRPFEVLTEQVTQNFRDGTQLITIADPNSDRKSTMTTYDRGERPRVIRREPEDPFQTSMI